jgi:hypothetical protein
MVTMCRQYVAIFSRMASQRTVAVNVPWIQRVFCVRHASKNPVIEITNIKCPRRKLLDNNLLRIK